MITVEALAAEDGDCLWVEWTAADGPHRMLVDGGRTGAALAARLDALPADDRHVDLLICTHVDRDHIGGLLPLFRRPPEGFTVGDVWFNSRHHLAADMLGYDDGEALTALLLRDRPWNDAFGGHAVGLPADGPPPEHALPGLTVTVLGPDRPRLARLLGEVGRGEAGAATGPADGELPLDALGDDDAPFPTDSLSGLLDLRFRADDSPANGSSIVVLLSHDDGTQVLLAGDAPAAPVVAALQRLPTGPGRVPVDLCKLPHHGSAGNVSPALLAALDCRHWLISTNGGPRGKHPSPATVARILARADAPTLWFNYTTAVTRRFGLPAVGPWGGTAVYPLTGDGITLEVGPGARVARVDPRTDPTG